MAERMLTRREVADMLHRTPQTLSRWGKTVPPVGPRFIRAVGGQALYRPEDVETWLRSHEAGGEEEETPGGTT